MDMFGSFLASFGVGGGVREMLKTVSLKMVTSAWLHWHFDGVKALLTEIELQWKGWSKRRLNFWHCIHWLTTTLPPTYPQAGFYWHLVRLYAIENTVCLGTHWISMLLFIFNFFKTNCTFPTLVTIMNHSDTFFPPACQQWHLIWLEKDSKLKNTRKDSGMPKQNIL